MAIWALGCLADSGMVKVSPQNMRRGLASAILLFFCLGVGSAQQTPSSPEANPRPSVVLDLSASDYRSPSRGDRLDDKVSGSHLDFVDEDHLLVTFDPKQLFRRDPNCPKEHSDRMMRALIVEIPSGKVIKQTTWYLHDHERYLWPLGSGQFLLRRLRTLYLVDSNLREKVLMESPTDLLWVSVTPDQTQILVESVENPAPQPSEAAAKSRPKHVLRFLDKQTLAVERTVALPGVVKLDGASSGYVDMKQKNDLWLIRYGPSAELRRNIARVRSIVMPRVFYASDNSLVIGRCCSASGGYSVSAFTVSGRRLWRQQWNLPRYYPSVSHSREGERFAVSTLDRKPGAGAPGDIGEKDANFGLEQNVQVFETATGTQVRSVLVDPIVVSGENFSLAPDGRRLAVLENATIKIYDLPPASSEEQTKFAELKADVPGVYLPASEDETEDLAATELTNQPEAQTATSDASAPAPIAAPKVENADAGSAPLATFHTGTQTVVVDVVVTDRKGQVVKGLRQQDFEVAEDGKAQELRYFREVKGAAAAQTESASSAKTEKPTPNVYGNTARASEPGPAIMLLLDLLNTPASDQEYARQELLKFLKNNGTKASTFALCTLGGDRKSPLRMVQGFTADENLLLAALDSKKSATRKASWQTSAQSSQNAVNSVGELVRQDARGWGDLLEAVKTSQAMEQQTETEERVRITTGALIQLANYLSGIPGRKTLIWLSGSFPVSLLAFDMNGQNPAVSSQNYGKLVERASNLLAQSQVAVYPVDVRGLDAGGMMPGIGVAGIPGRKISQTLATPFADNEQVITPQQQQSMAEMGARAAERATIEHIASATGGQAFYSSFGIAKAIATAAEQGSSYYSVSYNPANKNYDGKFRKIKVSLAEKGYHLYYRPGYFAKDTSASARDIARNIRIVAMQHGSPPSRQIHFTARVSPIGDEKMVSTAEIGDMIPRPKNKPAPEKTKARHHMIEYVVDSADLRFIPLTSGASRMALTFMVESFDAEGRPLTGIASASSNDLKPDAYKDVATRGFRAHQEIDVPANATSLRIGVQDQFSSYIGTVDIPLPVPPDQDMPRVLKNRLPEIEPN